MLLLDLSLALPRALFWSWGWWQKQAAFHIQFCVRHAVLWLFKSLRETVTCLMNGGWRLRSDVALPSLMKRVLDHGPVNRGWLIFTLLKFWQNNLSKLYHTCLVYSWSLMEHLCGPLWVRPFLVFSLKGSKAFAVAGLYCHLSCLPLWRGNCFCLFPVFLKYTVTSVWFPLLRRKDYIRRSHQIDVPECYLLTT